MLFPDPRIHRDPHHPDKYCHTDTAQSNHHYSHKCLCNRALSVQMCEEHDEQDEEELHCEAVSSPNMHSRDQAATLDSEKLVYENSLFNK